MKQEAVILPTTAAVTTTSATCDANEKPINGISADINATEADTVELILNGVVPLGAAETITPNIVSSTGTLVPAVSPATGAPVVLDSTHPSILLPGGFLYRLVKTATVAATGVDMNFKPRQK